MQIKNIIRDSAVLSLATLAILAASAPSSHVLGCIVGRSCSGGEVGSNEYLMPHEFEWALNYRGFKANKHYNGDIRQYQREINKNFVINRQNQWNATGTWGLTDQPPSTSTFPISTIAGRSPCLSARRPDFAGRSSRPAWAISPSAFSTGC